MRCQTDLLATLMMVVPASGFATGPSGPATLDTLLLYRGEWMVTAEHPWSGAPSGAVDRLSSACTRFTAYLACEQLVNGTPIALIVYNATQQAGTFQTRTIAPNGLAGARGSMTMIGNKWTYLDIPAPGLSGPWSRVENVIVSSDRIVFSEFESRDQGGSWTRINRGVEVRAVPGPLLAE